MVLNWQMFRLHGVPQLRDATVRSRALGDGNVSPWCVPGRQSVASFALHVSQKGPRTGKAPLHGNISPLCIQNELAMARYARHVCEKPCKSPLEDTSREYLARKTPFFAARTLRITHGARILPFLGASFGRRGRGGGGVGRGGGCRLAPAASSPRPHCCRRSIALSEPPPS